MLVAAGVVGSPPDRTLAFGVSRRSSMSLARARRPDQLQRDPRQLDAVAVAGLRPRPECMTERRLHELPRALLAASRIPQGHERQRGSHQRVLSLP